MGVRIAVLTGIIIFCQFCFESRFESNLMSMSIAINEVNSKVQNRKNRVSSKFLNQ